MFQLFVIPFPGKFRIVNGFIQEVPEAQMVFPENSR